MHSLGYAAYLIQKRRIYDEPEIVNALEGKLSAWTAYLM